MKKVIFTLLLLMFLFRFDDATALEACIPNNKPSIENTSDFFYKIGQPTPNYLENITAVDNCGNTVVTIMFYDELVNYFEAGDYTLYIYALESVVSVNVFVRVDIPEINGVSDLYIEINSDEVDYLLGITATDVINNNDITHLIEVDNRNIDYSRTGTYDLIYSVKDHLENETIKTVNVYIQDTIAPTIKNSKNIILEVNSDIVNFDFWEGISITDNSLHLINQDLNLGNLNIDTVGEYTIEYIAIDESNNEKRVPIKVKVIDTINPEIKNLSHLTILVNIVIERSHFTQNIVIEDNYDINISIEYLIVDYRLVDTSSPGIYPVFYFVSDSSGNYTYEIISVTVMDEDLPLIINTNNIRVPVHTESINYLDNISCEDLTDGNLTNQIIIDDHLVNLNVIGTYPLIYMIYDSSGNYDIKKVNVIVYDEEAPIISGVNDLVLEVKSQVTIDYFLSSVTAFDNSDQDITSSIEVDITQINFDEFGIYQIKYFVTDSSGNTAEIYANVSIVDTTIPVITGYQDVTIMLHQVIDDQFLLTNISVFDNYDGDISSQATVKGFFDSSIEGTYILTIEVIDSSGNVAEVTFNLHVIKAHVGDSDLADTSNYSIFYIIGGIGVSLIATGFLGYRTRKMR